MGEIAGCYQLVNGESITGLVIGHLAHRGPDDESFLDYRLLDLNRSTPSPSRRRRLERWCGPAAYFGSAK